MSAAPALQIFALPGLPMFKAGDDLAAALGDAIAATCPPVDGDVLVIAQKIVSKVEGRTVDLATVTPSAPAIALGAEIDKDPRLVEIILGESDRVVRSRPNLMIMQHRLGFVMANAGVDQSNVAPEDGVERALLLPADPDGSAEALRAALAARFGVKLGVIINDSFGRAWRRGTCGVAIGAAGIPCLVDLRGTPDLFGRILHVTVVGHADEIAAAASLVMGQAREGLPAVLVRGVVCDAPENTARELARPADEDLFR